MKMREKPYKRPQSYRINSDERKLYLLETELRKKLKECAEEWGRIAAENDWISDGERGDFYGVLLPQALFDLMDAYDTKACAAVCEAYLEKAKKDLSPGGGM